MARSKSKTAWELTVIVPGEAAAEVDDIRGPSSVQHARDILKEIADGRQVSSDKFEKQWSDTVTGLISNVDEWSKNTIGKWQIEEVKIGLTVTGEGKLAFIAKAGASGSIELKLSRRDSQTPGSTT